jgi:hypothetical protein
MICGQAELLHHLPHDQRDLAHIGPLAVARGIQVDEEIVRALDVVDARVPRVQLDAAEVDHPGKRRRTVDDREDGRVPAGELDELLADVVGMRRHALLVEEVPLDAIRVADHVEGATA